MIKFIQSFVICMWALLSIDVRAADTSPDKGKLVQKSEKTNESKKIVFLNASQNREGNTARLARQTLGGLQYSTVNLVDFRIDQIGQESKGDEYLKVIERLSHADILVIGTPVYWSDMSGYLKTFIDRLSGIMSGPLDSETAPLKGTDVYLIVQGTNPKDAIPGITTVIEHICRRFFMNYKGIILDEKNALLVNNNLK